MEKINYTISENGIATITMDDGKANAMDSDFFAELSEAIDSAENDKAKVVIFTGRSGFFSGGLNLNHLMSLSEEGIISFTETFARLMLRVFSLPIPTIAACSGHAIAGGAMLSFACDVRLIVDGAYKIQMNETLIGVTLPEWMSIIADSAVPSHLKTDILLLSEVYTPEKAINVGMFQGSCKDPEDLLSLAMDYAEKLSLIQSGAYAATKKGLYQYDTEQLINRVKEQLMAA